jgi:3-phosphoshikimate 1-carboxyvinyltransferase
MEKFGVRVRSEAGERYTVDAPLRYSPAVFAVEGDASGATYPFAAAAIVGGDVFVPGVLPSSHQPDAGFPAILGMMGCRVEVRDGGTLVSRYGTLRGIDVTMNGMPDAVPALVAVALFADGETTIRGVGQLRYKESNRLEGLAGELTKLGAEVGVEGDVMRVRQSSLHGALLGTLDDHRLAMSFALIGLRVPGVKIEDPGCVRKSFPAFWEELEQLLEMSNHSGR